MTIIIDEINIIAIMIGMAIGPSLVGPFESCIAKVKTFFTKKKTKEEIEEEKIEARLRHEKIHEWLRRNDEEMNEKLMRLER